MLLKCCNNIYKIKLIAELIILIIVNNIIVQTQFGKNLLTLIRHFELRQYRLVPFDV